VKKAERPALARDSIVRTALAVLDDVGLDDLSMRRLADALGVQNPALYWHVKDKQELLDRMAQVLLTEGFAAVAVPEPRVWSKKLERLARGLRAGMRSRRDGARVLAAAHVSAPGSVLLAHVDSVVAALTREGFGPTDALGGVLTVLHYTMGATLEEQSDPDGGEPSLVPGTDLPALRALAAHVMKGNGTSRVDARFELGIQLVIDGLRARKRRKG
jgi:TetR/AcrR family tetracycline transcriptional repressor